MKLREHRGSLANSMAICVEIDPTLQALTTAIKGSLCDLWHGEKKDISVEYYGYDDRIKWDTYIVIIKGYGVYGFTDSPVKDNV